MLRGYQRMRYLQHTANDRRVFLDFGELHVLFNAMSWQDFYHEEAEIYRSADNFGLASGIVGLFGWLGR